MCRRSSGNKRAFHNVSRRRDVRDSQVEERDRKSIMEEKDRRRRTRKKGSQ